MTDFRFELRFVSVPFFVIRLVVFAVFVDFLSRKHRRCSS
jgi:hypothetical protein